MSLEHWRYRLPLLLRSVFRRGRVERELDEELAYHFEREGRTECRARHERGGRSRRRASFARRARFA